MEDIWQKIYASSLKFLVPQPLEEVYPVIVNEAIALVGGSYGSIFAVRGTRPIRVFASSEKLFNIVPRKRGNTYKVYETRTPSLVQRKNLVPNPYLQELKIESDLTVPLVYGHITLGVLSVMSTKGKVFGPKEVEILQLFAPLATIALRKAYLNDELKKAIDSRDLFMSLAAHELKTPITVISAYSELLLKNPPNDKDKLYATKIYNELYRLKNLINEFLQIDSDKKGKLTYSLQQCDLGIIARNCIDNFRKTINTHEIAFRNLVTNRNTIVHIDPDKIRQVITNILNNAVKFSPKNSIIEITLKETEKTYILSVRDKGQGIQKADLEHIFERFYRGSSNKPGMGLGLYLSKQIIDYHKGTIKISSVVGEGTTLTVSLPKHSPNVSRT